MQTTKFPSQQKCLILAAAITSIMWNLQVQAQSAQASTNPLEVIVVTSSHIPTPVRQITTSVSVITETDLEAHGNMALTDVLRQLPSVATSTNGGAGKTTSLRIRGEEGFRTLTIFDGIRLSDPSGPQIGPQLEHLLSSGIGRVEILRGPQGLSYGADAGGIVNIISRQAATGVMANFDAQAGKFGTQQYSLDAGAGSDKADIFVSAAQFETDGFNTRTTDTVLRDNDGYENTTLHVRGGYNITDKLRVELVHRDISGVSQYDGCFSTTTFSTIHDCAGKYDMQATRGSATYTGEDFSHSVSYATTKTVRDDLSAGISAFSSKGELNRWEYVGSATNLPGFDLVFGADQEEAVNGKVSRDNTGLFTEVLSDFSKDLFLNAGVRYDDNDDFGTNTSERLGAAYVIDMPDSGTVKFKTSYGSGFRAPSPYEIEYNSGPYSYPPAAGLKLKQETSDGFEVGAEFLQGDKLKLEAIYFSQEVENAIYFDLASFSGYLQDVGVSKSRGIELSGQWKVNDNWNLTANYTHDKTKQPNGQPRRRRPEELINLGVSWMGLDQRLNLNAFYRISQDSYDQSGASLVKLDDFGVLDLTGSFNVTSNIQVYGRLENALDEKYEEIASYRTAGRAAYVGVRLKFKGM